MHAVCYFIYALKTSTAFPVLMCWDIPAIWKVVVDIPVPQVCPDRTTNVETTRKIKLTPVNKVLLALYRF